MSKKKLIQSFSIPNLYYVVKLGKHPKCTCKDFEYRKKESKGKCKHIKLAEQLSK